MDGRPDRRKDRTPSGAGEVSRENMPCGSARRSLLIMVSFSSAWTERRSAGRWISTIRQWSRKEHSLGVFDIAAGNHVLEVEMVGANQKAKDRRPGPNTRYLFGTDFLEWRPAD